ncbi:zinc transporter ZntB [Marinobacter koreensis]|uniref:Zinc transporter ZntB n=1 Tax=Marinobacter koreensis TaxID=335974 RepID=A0ABW0RL48_9GAMM|nr:zinc transporter ZntB [Marinobacter koreensis]MCK7547891.1 zinc transporter ZntB [Marinobacter koreensis]MDX1818526.1 zinc transporter ZntB [Marinobacter sp.]
MNDNSGLIFAFTLDGNGGGSKLDLDAVRQWRPDSGPIWVHLDYTGSDARDWLQNHSGIDPVIVEALTAAETRPRSLVHRDGMLVILRGVNLNPDSDPEDMVSIRFWIDSDRIVTLRHRRVMAVDDLRQAVEDGDGPTGPGDFLSQLADRLVQRMGGVISDLDDTADELEDEVISEQTYDLRQKIANVRRMAISMRRYLAPQRDVMARLHTEKAEWLHEDDRMRLREIADRTTRYVEDLDAIRDRASVTQEEVNGRLAERMNRTMYILSIVAGIFLPLGLLTGLLGINVGGIPGTDNSWAFTIFCGLLVVIAVAQVWVFKRKKWM